MALSYAYTKYEIFPLAKGSARFKKKIFSEIQEAKKTRSKPRYIPKDYFKEGQFNPVRITSTKVTGIWMIEACAKPTSRC